MGKDRTERVELTTLVMVEDGNGRVLVQDRLDPDFGGICFPGGHVEPGESFVKAAVREVLEETGLTIENPTLCGMKQFPIAGGRYLVLLFKADQFSGTLRDSEEGPVFWTDVSLLPKERLSNNFQDVLDICQSDHLSEFFWYQENEDWKYEIL